MTEQTTLADKIERAEGPSRELDAAVFTAIGGALPSHAFGMDIALEQDPENPSSFVVPIGEMRVRYECPAYTASIDAAMTLVPEGYAVGFKRAPCQRSHAMLATIGYEANASGDTPALALTAAALRAREASHSKSGEE